MRVFTDRIEFSIEKGTSAAQQREKRFTDRAAIEIFGVALWYAQRDGEGDHRFDASPQETKDFLIWRELCRRAMAGLIAQPAETPVFSVATRLAHAEELKGAVILGPEIPILGDMVELLPHRTAHISGNGAPRYNAHHQAKQEAVYRALRIAEAQQAAATAEAAVYCI